MTDLLRICTAGNVDDGKSTLIGRLLYDSRGVYDDQVRAVRRADGAIDFSLFTDGLRAEREQGITIDVAYRYFATARRKFILADTPGHQQYTRNMATGASTADVAIVLVDARHGVRPQSQRHAQIARLLGINEFVLAINKMDLVGFDQGVFERIVTDFCELRTGARIQAVPMSALHGDNVIASSPRTPWYDGPSLLEFLETVDVPARAVEAPFRYPVQLVLRSTDGFRGYAGRILSGTVRVGDTVTAWPSGLSTRVTRIVTRNGDLDVADATASVALALGDELDLGRGDVLAIGAPHVGTRFEANVVWMDERPLDPARHYRLKQTTRTVWAEVDCGLQLNEIGRLTVTTSRPIIYDPYGDNKGTGSFVLIDPDSHFTAGAGMIVRPLAGHAGTDRWRAAAERLTAIVRGADTDTDAVDAVRRALEELL